MVHCSIASDSPTLGFSDMNFLFNSFVKDSFIYFAKVAGKLLAGVETVKQSLNSIERNQGLFHSLNAHRHNEKKLVLELEMRSKFKVNQAPN